MKNEQLPFDCEHVLRAMENRKELQTFLQKLQDTEVIGEAEAILITNATPEEELMIRKCLSLLPVNTLQRNHLQEIMLMPPVWIRKGVTYENIRQFEGGPVTANVEDAASLFSLPWGRTRQMPREPFMHTIELFSVPADLDCEAWVLELYMYYVIIHELGHVYSNAIYFSMWRAEEWLKITDAEKQKKTYLLDMGGSPVTGDEYAENFKEHLITYGPFGDYTAGYQKEEDETLWFQEWFADAFASFLMGFMMYPDRSFEPLPQQVSSSLRQFLFAPAIIKR